MFAGWGLWDAFWLSFCVAGAKQEGEQRYKFNLQLSCLPNVVYWHFFLQAVAMHVFYLSKQRCLSEEQWQRTAEVSNSCGVCSLPSRAWGSHGTCWRLMVGSQGGESLMREESYLVTSARAASSGLVHSTDSRDPSSGDPNEGISAAITAPVVPGDNILPSFGWTRNIL